MPGSLHPGGLAHAQGIDGPPTVPRVPRHPHRLGVYASLLQKYGHRRGVGRRRLVLLPQPGVFPNRCHPSGRLQEVPQQPSKVLCYKAIFPQTFNVTNDCEYAFNDSLSDLTSSGVLVP